MFWTRTDDLKVTSLGKAEQREPRLKYLSKLTLEASAVVVGSQFSLMMLACWSMGSATTRKNKIGRCQRSGGIKQDERWPALIAVDDVDSCR